MMIVTLRRRKRVLANRTKTMLLLSAGDKNDNDADSDFFLLQKPAACWLLVSTLLSTAAGQVLAPSHHLFIWDQMVAFGFKYPGFRTMITGWGASERKMLILFLIWSHFSSSTKESSCTHLSHDPCFVLLTLIGMMMMVMLLMRMAGMTVNRVKSWNVAVFKCWSSSLFCSRMRPHHPRPS